MVPLAFADEAEGAAASPSVGSEVAPPTDKEASLNKALDDVATLEAGTDYDPGTMLALIDGAAVQADGSLTSGLQGGGEGISSLGSVEPVATGSWLGGLALVRVDVPDGMSTEEAAALLAADDNVVDFSLGYVCEPGTFPRTPRPKCRRTTTSMMRSTSSGISVSPRSPGRGATCKTPTAHGFAGT